MGDLIETNVRRKCGMCGYVGTLTDDVGQCPRCRWDELSPADPEDRDPIHESSGADQNKGSGNG